MGIARLLTTQPSVDARCQHWWEGPEVIMFKQVSCLGHQMSLANGVKVPAQ